MGNPRLPTGSATLAKVFVFAGVLNYLAPNLMDLQSFVSLFLLLTGLMRRHPYSQRAYAEADREAEGYRA
jgi:hypothetical protein